MSISVLKTPFLSQRKTILTIVIFSLATISSSFITTNPSKDDTLPYPVIGILTQPSAFSTFGYPSTQFSYIAGSYVKHLETAGATVVPIQWDLPFDQIDVLLSKVNGVLFPGGGSTLVNKTDYTPSKFTQTGMHIVQKALEFNKNGDYFPIWGTCLGYELLVLSISTNMSLLINVTDGDDSAKNLNVTHDGLNGLYADLTLELLNSIETQQVSYFHHKYTPDPNAFTADANLASNFTVAAWTYDSLAGQYAASVQGTAHPFMGTQFHPEKNTFEWFSNITIPHTLEAVLAQQYHAFYFVNETLKSTHQFNSEDDLVKSWIYNYKPKHFGPDPQFEEVYLFRNYQAHSPSQNLVSEYPPGCEPHEESVSAAPAEVQDMNEVFKFKEAAPFLFTK